MNYLFGTIYAALACLIWGAVSSSLSDFAMAYGLITVCTVVTHYAYLQDRKRERNYNDDDTWPCDY